MITGRLCRGCVKVNGVVRYICMMRDREGLCVCRVILVGRGRWVRLRLAATKAWGPATLGKCRLFIFLVIFLMVVGGCFFRVLMRLCGVIVMGVWMCMSGSGRGWGRAVNRRWVSARVVVGVWWQV